ncbi:MAG: hypothetical protein ACRC6O_08710 [Flavobacterium sp.]
MPFEFRIDKKVRAALDDYANGRPGSMTFVNSYEDGKQAVLNKVATPLSKIYKNDYGHSILVIFDTITADELNKYDTMASRLIPNGFSYKKLLNEDDKLFLKLKIKDHKYEAAQWLNPEDDYDFEGSNLNLCFNLSVWINFESKTSGAFLKLISLTKV